MKAITAIMARAIMTAVKIEEIPLSLIALPGFISGLLTGF